MQFNNLANEKKPRGWDPGLTDGKHVRLAIGQHEKDPSLVDAIFIYLDERARHVAGTS
jgi:hypothetical protein